MTDQWYIRRDGVSYGPFSAGQLKQLATSGRLTADDTVREGEKGEWSAARRVRAFFPSAKPNRRPHKPLVLASAALGAGVCLVLVVILAVGGFGKRRPPDRPSGEGAQAVAVPRPSQGKKQADADQRAKVDPPQPLQGNPGEPGKPPPPTVAAKEPEPQPKDDRTILQGRWYAVSEEVAGKAGSEDAIITMSKVADVTGDRMRIERTEHGKRGVYEGTFRLVPSVTPKQFDWEGTAVGGQAELHGIYELTEDTFRVCYMFVPKGGKYTRPDEYRTFPGSSRVYVTFKRSQRPKKTSAAKEDKVRAPLIPIYKVVSPLGVELTTDLAVVKRIAAKYPGNFTGGSGHHQGVLGYAYASPQADADRLRCYFNSKAKRYVYSTVEMSGEQYTERPMNAWVPTRQVSGATPRYVFFRPGEDDCEYGVAGNRDFFRKCGFGRDRQLCLLFDSDQ